MGEPEIVEHTFHTQPSSENLAYIKTLVHSMGATSLLDVPVNSIFEHDLVDYERVTINRIVGQWMVTERDRLAALIPDIDLTIINEYVGKKCFQSGARENLAFQLRRSNNDAESKRNDIVRIQRRTTELFQLQLDCVAKSRRLETQIANLNENDENKEMIEAISAVINGGEWLYIGSYDHGDDMNITTWSTPKQREGTRQIVGHTFITKQDIVCSLSNPAAGIYENHNYGKVLVAIGKDFNIVTTGFVINFTQNSGTEHPHLHGGSICWGDSFYRYEEEVQKRSMIGTLTIFQNLMQQYCPDRPYTTLKDSKALDEQHGRRRVFSALPNEMMKFIPESWIPQAELDRRAAIAAYVTVSGEIHTESRGIPSERKAALSTAFNKLLSERANKLIAWLGTNEYRYDANGYDWQDNQCRLNRIETYMANEGLLFTKQELISLNGVDIGLYAGNRRDYLLYATLFSKNIAYRALANSGFIRYPQRPFTGSNTNFQRTRQCNVRTRRILDEELSGERRCSVSDNLRIIYYMTDEQVAVLAANGETNG